MKTAKATVLASLLLLTTTLNVKAADPDLELPKPATEMTVADWSAYEGHIVEGLRSDHDGIVQAALRLSIQYAEVVSIDDALLDVMSVYRNHSDARVRHLAAVALASTDNELALGYLRLSLDFEKNEAIRHTIKAATSRTI